MSMISIQMGDFSDDLFSAVSSSAKDILTQGASAAVSATGRALISAAQGSPSAGVAMQTATPRQVTVAPPVYTPASPMQSLAPPRVTVATPPASAATVSVGMNCYFQVDGQSYPCTQVGFRTAVSQARASAAAGQRPVFILRVSGNTINMRLCAMPSGQVVAPSAGYPSGYPGGYPGQYPSQYPGRSYPSGQPYGYGGGACPINYVPAQDQNTRLQTCVQRTVMPGAYNCHTGFRAHYNAEGRVACARIGMGGYGYGARPAPYGYGPGYGAGYTPGYGSGYGPGYRPSTPPPSAGHRRKVIRGLDGLGDWYGRVDAIRYSISPYRNAPTVLQERAAYSDAAYKAAAYDSNFRQNRRVTKETGLGDWYSRVDTIRYALAPYRTAPTVLQERAQYGNAASRAAARRRTFAESIDQTRATGLMGYFR